ncbi:MAG: RHS repeat-associated core domain-containing protein [Candidatus Kapabacteria bacterium]|nr:RHS repeat-associated core domain-containing protein [Candidatus Kapabacteria bacterium]
MIDKFLNYKSYEPYGEIILDTLGVTRQSYIGKEKDVESKLGDHGVRKYDYETGRFNSIDTLFE